MSLSRYDIDQILASFNFQNIVTQLVSAANNNAAGLANIGEGIKTLANSIEKVGEGVIDEMAQRRLLDERIHEESQPILTVKPPNTL